MNDHDKGLNREQWQEKLEALGDALKKQGAQADIVALGSVPNILAGQPVRTTIDFDIWKPSSNYSEKALKQAAEKAGLLYDPKGVLEPDTPYIQVVRPGIVQLGEFQAQPLENFGGLNLQRPPIENLIAGKLCRASEQDIEDIAWLMGQNQVSKQDVEAVIKTFPRQQRSTATENLIYLDTITATQNQKTTAQGLVNRYLSDMAERAAQYGNDLKQNGPDLSL